MKNLLLIYIFLTVVCNIQLAVGQDDKAEKKEWAKRLKEMDPLQLKKIMEENEKLKAELAAKNNTISELQNSLVTGKEELKKTKDEYTGYKSSVQTATLHGKNETDATVTPEIREKLSKGVVFKVQIGAFKNKDLSKYFENNKNFSGDVDPDGIKKYTLGYFNDYWEAESFKKYLREMGVKDAWIVPYKNGQRVNIRDVLEGIL